MLPFHFLPYDLYAPVKAWSKTCRNKYRMINNTDFVFSKIVKKEDGSTCEVPVHFRHNPAAKDDLEHSLYTNSINNGCETSIMNLGHGRAGHLPDYSFAHYRYQPAWGRFFVNGSWIIYYVSMGLHMVGGRVILYRALITLDLGVFALTIHGTAQV